MEVLRESDKRSYFDMRKISSSLSVCMCVCVYIYIYIYIYSIYI